MREIPPRSSASHHRPWTGLGSSGCCYGSTAPPRRSLRCAASVTATSWRDVADGWSVVVKVSNSAEDGEVVAMENAAMTHVERIDPDLAIPRVVPTESGAQVVAATADDGRVHLVRAVTLLPGVAADTTDLPAGFPRELGDWAARLASALADFDHPGGHRRLEWDPRLVHDLSPYAELLPTTRGSPGGAPPSAPRWRRRTHVMASLRRCSTRT